MPVAVPKSSGIGTGEAQVFDTSGLVRSFNALAQKRALESAKKQAMAQKAKEEVSGKFDDIYKSKIFEARDSDLFKEKVNQLYGKYNGQWEKIYRGGNPVSDQFSKDMQDIMIWAKKSQATKEFVKQWGDKVLGTDNYSDAKKQGFETLYDTPGLMVDEVNKEMLVPDKKLPNVNEHINKYVWTNDFIDKVSGAPQKVSVDGVDQLKTTMVEKLNKDRFEQALRNEYKKSQEGDNLFSTAVNQQYSGIAEEQGITPLEAYVQDQINRHNPTIIQPSYKNVPTDEDGWKIGNGYAANNAATFSGETVKEGITPFPFKTDYIGQESQNVNHISYKPTGRNKKPYYTTVNYQGQDVSAAVTSFDKVGDKWYVNVNIEAKDNPTYDERTRELNKGKATTIKVPYEGKIKADINALFNIDDLDEIQQKLAKPDFFDNDDKPKIEFKPTR